MHSMFSPFDALCADFLGKKTQFSTTSAETNKKNGVLVKKIEETENFKEKKRERAAAAAPVRDHHKAPRFAPELDGLYCFETLVSY
ncbi:hypothetical protein HS088_TW16G00818 [Tripterygium wilfordii]|uniref:Uncharacterized protein n=2 Tax=Tripterygium wilfordii TaxID=458696 RepID=A0A7J7CJY5_TRIWF|nr:hypothetical protein HS088_TW16G00818 [Tripterygium wilfordii]